MSEVTRILDQIQQGDPDATEQLLPLVYAELRRLAAQMLAKEKPGHTLQPTDLVHEAYLRLVANGDPAGPREPSWDTRGHFFAAAAAAMRRILVESARRKQRGKHGGGRQRVDLLEHDVPVEPGTNEAFGSDDILALDRALTRLAEEDAEASQVVHLHFFAGLSIEQAANVLGVSRATAYRQWSFARAWLGCAMEENP
jgi:RNA polymerase sigma factor (TIGR02999 family)